MSVVSRRRESEGSKMTGQFLLAIVQSMDGELKKSQEAQ
jgi:hypothetical protein